MDHLWAAFRWFSIITVNCPINGEAILSHKDKLTFRRETQAVSLGLNPSRKIVGKKPDFMCILGCEGCGC